MYTYALPYSLLNCDDITTMPSVLINALEWSDSYYNRFYVLFQLNPVVNLVEHFEQPNNPIPLYFILYAYRLYGLKGSTVHRFTLTTDLLSGIYRISDLIWGFRDVGSLGTLGKEPKYRPTYVLILHPEF
jgi:hypothetical protein